jgi:hypothetical protein
MATCRSKWISSAASASESLSERLHAASEWATDSHKRLRFVVHLCRWIAGEPQPLASQQVRWVDPAELDAYPFPAANARIIAALRQRLGIAPAPAPASAAAGSPQAGESRTAA